MHRVRLLSKCAQCPTRNRICLDSAGKRTFCVFQGKSPYRALQENQYVGQSTNLSKSSHYLQNVCACSSVLHPGRRAYSTGDGDGTEGKIKPVFVAIPNPIKLIKNKIFVWLIRSYFDEDFSIEDFTQGAKQALVTISQQIAEGALGNLEGLLSPKLLREVTNTCHNLSLREISSFSVTDEDILHTFPHDITIHYDDKGGKFLFILMKFWCHSIQSGSSDPEVKGFRIGRPPPGMPQEQFDSLGSVYSCTYEFLRNVSPGANPHWTITYIQHGQLINSETKGLPDEE